jgi:hypothetical protein
MVNPHKINFVKVLIAKKNAIYPPVYKKNQKQSSKTENAPRI